MGAYRISAPIVYVSILAAGILTGLIISRVAYPTVVSPLSVSTAANVNSGQPTAAAALPVKYSAIVASNVGGRLLVAVPSLSQSAEKPFLTSLQPAAGAVIHAMIPKTAVPASTAANWDYSKGLPPPPQETEDIYNDVPLKLSDLKKDDVIDFVTVQQPAEGGDTVVNSITWVTTLQAESEPGGVPKTTSQGRFPADQPKGAPQP